MYRRLPAEVRKVTRTVARECLIQKQGHRRSASAMVHRELPPVIKKMYPERGFRSLLTTIIISIAVRLAVALIFHWIDKYTTSGFSTVPGTYQMDEPGYSSDL